MNNWFKGKDDPNLVIFSVSIVSAKYWIAENNAMVSFFENDTNISGESGVIDLSNYGNTAYLSKK